MKRYLSFLFLPLILVLFASCQSVPPPTRSIRTLVIIPFGKSRTNSRESIGRYEIYVLKRGSTDIAGTFELPKNKKFMAIETLPPGEYTIGAYRYYATGGNPGGGPPIRCDYPFNVYDGKVVFTRVLFTYMMGNAGDLGWTKILVPSVSDGDVQVALYNKLAKRSKDFRKWELGSFGLAVDEEGNIIGERLPTS